MMKLLLIACTLFCGFVNNALAEANDPTSALSDNFFTYNLISPACRGQTYYKIVEIKPSGKIVREFVRFNQDYSYYVPNWQTYGSWVNYVHQNKGQMRKTDFKEMVFVSANGPVASFENMSGVTATSFNNLEDNYKHKPPIEPKTNFLIPDTEGRQSNIRNIWVDNGYYPYLLTVSNQNNGIWPICIGGCAFARNPMASRVVECIEGTIKMLIMDPSEKNNGKSVFQAFQSKIKTLVSMIIIVFIALLGLQTFLGQGLAKDGLKTIIFSVVKIGVVSYFAIGDAWKDQFFYMLKDIVSGASSIIYQSVAGENYDGCYFDTMYYPRGFEINSIFDSLDCKVANYIGFFKDQQAPVLANAFLTFLLFPPVVGTIMNVLITSYVTGIFNVVTLMVQMYIGSSIYIMLLIFISPVIMPTMLFSAGVVKSMFDGWLKTLIGVCLSQILSVMLFSLFIPLIDNTMYGLTTEEKTALFVPTSDLKVQQGMFSFGGAELNQPGLSEVNQFITNSLNGVSTLKPAQLNPSINIMDVSSSCNAISSWSFRKGMVCVLKRATGYAQIPILPFILRIFVVYIPTPDSIIAMPFTFVYTIFVLMIISNLMISSQALIDKLSSSTGASGMSSAQASTADLALAAGVATSETSEKYNSKKDDSDKPGSENPPPRS